MGQPPVVTPIQGPIPPTALDALTHMFCRAFSRDAHINWIIRQDVMHAEACRQFFRLLLTDLLGDQGRLYATTDLKAAAICFPPHAKSLSLPMQARASVRFAGITGWRNLLVRAYGLNRMEGRHPKMPHYFLQTIGVDPDFQGRGYGSAMLSAVLADSVIRGIPAYLETCTEMNLGFYERHGFKVMAECRLPRGPKLWQLLCIPR